MQVREIMCTDILGCTKDTSLRDAAAIMCEKDCGSLPVFESAGSRKLIGIITDRDIVCRTLGQGKDPYQMAVGDCMSMPVITVTPETSLDECRRRMEKNQVRRVPVIDASGRCCGMVSQADLALKCEQEEAGELVKEVSKPTPLASAVR